MAALRPKVGDRRRDVELGEKAGLDRHDPDREQKPRGDVQRHAKNDDAEAQHEMIEAQNKKARGGADDQVQLYPGIAAEQRDEAEQGHAFGASDDQPAENLADPVHQRHAESPRDQAEIDRDNPAIGGRIGHRVRQRVGARRNHDQTRQRIQDLEPAADAQRISGGAKLEKTGDRMLQAALRQ
jgi:hypothetical protein